MNTASTTTRTPHDPTGAFAYRALIEGPSSELLGFASMGNRVALRILQESVYAAKTRDEIVRLIVNSWSYADARGLVRVTYYRNEEQLGFKLLEPSDAGTTVTVSLCRNAFARTDPTCKPWILKFARATREPFSEAAVGRIRTVNDESFATFCRLESINAFVEQLAAAARPEPWSVAGGIPGYLLFKYFRMAFSRAMAQGRVALSELYAVFNTGLEARDGGGAVFACFKRAVRGADEDAGERPWAFAGFAAAGETDGRGVCGQAGPSEAVGDPGEAATILGRFAGRLPEPAGFELPASEPFDASLPLAQGADDIVLRGLKNLPRTLLAETIGDDPRAAALLERMDHGTAGARAAAQRELAQLLSAPDAWTLRNRLVPRVQAALEAAVARAEDPRYAAVLGYNATSDRVCFYVPVTFGRSCEDGRPVETVAVFNLNQVANHRPCALIEPAAAYASARLLHGDNWPTEAPAWLADLLVTSDVAQLAGKVATAGETAEAGAGECPADGAGSAAIAGRPAGEARTAAGVAVEHPAGETAPSPADDGALQARTGIGGTIGRVLRRLGIGAKSAA